MLPTPPPTPAVSPSPLYTHWVGGMPARRWGTSKSRGLASNQKPMCIIQSPMCQDLRHMSPSRHIFLDLKIYRALSQVAHPSKLILPRKFHQLLRSPGHGVLTTASERRPKQCSPEFYWQDSNRRKPCVFLPTESGSYTKVKNHKKLL